MNGYECIIDAGDRNESVAPPIKSHGLLHSIIHCSYAAPLLHGQCISILISGTGIFASLLSSRDANCPMLLSTLNYFLLSLYMIMRWREHGTQLQLPWWSYLCVAILDVEANVLVVTAYNYTSITSIMLLDCFSIPCVMVLSIIFLKTRYNIKHVIGVMICLLGMGCIVLSDAYVDKGSDDDGKNPVKGDILCLVSNRSWSLNILNVMKLMSVSPFYFNPSYLYLSSSTKY
jgi:solute carrier family 35, member F1/2